MKKPTSAFHRARRRRTARRDDASVPCCTDGALTNENMTFTTSGRRTDRCAGPGRGNRFLRSYLRYCHSQLPGGKNICRSGSLSMPCLLVFAFMCCDEFFLMLAKSQKKTLNKYDRKKMKLRQSLRDLENYSDMHSCRYFLSNDVVRRHRGPVEGHLANRVVKPRKSFAGAAFEWNAGIPWFPFQIRCDVKATFDVSGKAGGVIHSGRFRFASPEPNSAQ